MDEAPLTAEGAKGEAPDTPAIEPALVDPEIARARNVEAFQAGLSRETRSTGIWMLVWGGLSLLASGFFNASWGILLIVIGIGSFFIKDVAMLVVYAITMAWAALWNLLSSYLGGTWTWAVFSLLQVYWAVRIFQGFARFRRARAELFLDDNEGGRITRVLPASGCLMSAIAAFGVAVFTVLIIAMSGSGVPPIDERIITLSENLILNIAILGFAISLGALLSGYRYKALSIIGMVVCLLLIIGWLILILLPSEPGGMLT